MAIYPNRKKSPEMIQMNSGGQVRSQMEGLERIYSREDAKKIISMARAAKSQKDLVALGKFVASATKKQDARKPEYV